MWLVDKNFNNQYGAFSKIGKSLVLAQKYESTCKDIIGWFMIVDKLIKTEFNLLDEDYIIYSNVLSKMMLGRKINSINKIKEMLRLKDDELVILDEARKARNWIAHDSCYELIKKNISLNKADYKVDKKLKENVIRLAKADFLVSKWSYEFHEKNSLYDVTEVSYIESILKWIGL